MEATKRNEVQLSPTVLKVLDKIAESENRSRKNLMENVLISFALNHSLNTKKK